jgi:hypothetical protein
METLSQMTMTVLDRTPVAGDAGGVTGERPERPDPEVPERARRRTFTAQLMTAVFPLLWHAVHRSRPRPRAGPVFS